jgi:DNA-binding response OmpR family regulator
MRNWQGHQESIMAKILCMDSEPHVVVLKAAILEAAGHSVVTALATGEAVTRLGQDSYDLVITEWLRGDAKALIVAAKSQGITVIIITGRLAEARASADPPADLYFEKPINPEELVNAVNDLLKGRSSLP